MKSAFRFLQFKITTLGAKCPVMKDCPIVRSILGLLWRKGYRPDVCILAKSCNGVSQLSSLAPVESSGSLMIEFADPSGSQVTRIEFDRNTIRVMSSDVWRQQIWRVLSNEALNELEKADHSRDDRLSIHLGICNSAIAPITRDRWEPMCSTFVPAGRANARLEA